MRGFSKARDELSQLGLNSPSVFLKSCIAFACVGFGAWFPVSALFNQMSNIFEHVYSPHKRFFYALLSVLIQSSKLPAFIYAYVRPREHFYTLAGLLSLAVLVDIVMASTWSRTVYSLGQPWLLPLLLMAALAGCVGSISMVSMFPYAAAFPSHCVKALSVGVGISGLLALLLSLCQGQQHSGSLNFSVSTYFGISAALGCIPILALVWIRNTYAGKLASKSSCGDRSLHTIEKDFSVASESADIEKVSLSSQDQSQQSKANVDGRSRLQIALPWMLAVWFSCLAQYATPGMLPFVILGPQERNTYTTELFWLSQVVLNIGSLVGRAVCFALQSDSFKHVGVAVVLQLIGLIYALVAAAQNLSGHFPFVVSVLILLVAATMHGYIITQSFVWSRTISMKQRRMIDAPTWIAVANEFGSLSGSLLSLALTYSHAIHCHAPHSREGHVTHNCFTH